LIQLKKLVHELPKIEPTPYAFEYKDASSLPEELEEWFSYSPQERSMLFQAKASFAQDWASYNGGTSLSGAEYQSGDVDWTNATVRERSEFVEKALSFTKENDISVRIKSLQSLVYIALGCWYETGGAKPGVASTTSKSAGPELVTDFSNSHAQLSLISQNVDMIFKLKGVQPLLDVLKAACEREW